jgi:hypothetical protein
VSTITVSNRMLKLCRVRNPEPYSGPARHWEYALNRRGAKPCSGEVMVSAVRRIARPSGNHALAGLYAAPPQTMPNLMFEPDELRNLIAYVLTLKERE